MTGKSYEATYIGADFQHVAKNLELVLKIFSERSKGTKLILNGVPLKNDHQFVDRTVGFLKTLGFRSDQIEIKLPNNFGGLFAGSPVEPSRGIHTFKDLCGQQPELCSVLTDNPGVYADGRATPCGCVDNSSALIIGDINKESLRDMGYGARYEALLNAFVSGDISKIPLCSDCDVPYCGSRMVT